MALARAQISAGGIFHCFVALRGAGADRYDGTDRQPQKLLRSFLAGLFFGPVAILPMSEAGDPKKRPVDKDDDAESSQKKRSRHDDAATNVSSGEVTVNYHWLDRGVVDPETGRNYHEAIRLTVEDQSFDVRRGDVVRLNSEDADPGDDWICKVDSLWDDGDAVTFRGLWFFSRDEINQYNGLWDGVMTKAGLIKKMRAKERVLSDRTDDNDIGSILSVVRLVHKIPGMNIDVPPDSILCRYRLETSSTRWHLFEYSGGQTARRHDQATDEPTLTNDTLDDDSSTASSGASSALSDQVRIEGEGSNLRR